MTELKPKANRPHYSPRLGIKMVQDYIAHNMEQHQPFFMFYSMLLAHGPFDTGVPPELQGTTEGKQSEFDSMMTETDRLIGQLNDFLDANNYSDDVLLMIIGDNGTPRGTEGGLAGSGLRLLPFTLLPFNWFFCSLSSLTATHCCSIFFILWFCFAAPCFLP